METLLWLLPLPAAVVYALVRNAWVSRSRPPEAPQASLARYERFRSAVEGRPQAQSAGRRRRRGSRW